MTKMMLIDGLHEEETRVVITDNNGKIDSFDFTSSSKTQIKGNVYLAKITRVEPSLQAAFVEYGCGKQGFLPFSEIHPDYYQIPVEDRKKLLEEEAELAAREEAEDEAEVESKTEEKEERKTRSRSHRRRRRTPRNNSHDNNSDESPTNDKEISQPVDASTADNLVESKDISKPKANDSDIESKAKNEVKTEVKSEVKSEVKNTPKESPDSDKTMAADSEEKIIETSSEVIKIESEIEPKETVAEPNKEKSTPIENNTKDTTELEQSKEAPKDSKNKAKASDSKKDSDNQDDNDDDYPTDEVEEIGAVDDVSEEISKPRRNITRRYKIQEVIKSNQIILVQVTKEERGNKGVSLTTYISLPGRYCVLMPNALKSGGISRKISKAEDRKRLKEVMAEMKKARGMSAIIRTAGIDRTKVEIKRDYEFLIKLWTEIRENAIASIAPACVHEEGDIIKRTLRDSYTSEIEKILVQGEDIYNTAKEFMKMIMPSHAARVKHYKDDMPIFHAYEVENQLQAMHKPVAKMPSGGYIDINPTEALISVDVNSGRSTGERNVEETALKTNLEAARELARQLRLRDLAGLIVVDFIDMYQSKNRRAVERAFKDALKIDRAKIQIGRISSFGLLEMSRQRLRPSIAETINAKCGICAGTGLIRSSGSLAFEIIRMLLREASSGRYREIRVNTTAEQAIFMLNKYRQYITDVEKMGSLLVVFHADGEELDGKDFILEKITHSGAIEKSDRTSQPSSKGKKRQRKPRNNKNKNTQPKQSSVESTTDNKNPSQNSNQPKDAAKPVEKPAVKSAKPAEKPESKKPEPKAIKKPEVKVAPVVVKPIIEKALPEDTPKKKGPPRKGWWRRVAK